MTKSGNFYWFEHEGNHYRIPGKILTEWEDLHGIMFWEQGIVPNGMPQYEKSMEGVEIYKP